MSVLDYEFVLARVDGLGVWNFYPTLEAATLAAPDVNSRNKEQYAPKTWAEYKKEERDFWLRDPATEITEEKFTEMLCVLPPLKWETGRGGDFESFLLSEFTSGVFTQQYARHGETYWTKTVDAFDRSTWITAIEETATK